MNSPFDTFAPEPLPGGALDRLVDGSLPDAERRTLLVRLDNEPDGWRRCALAFLEAQAWREAFAPLAISAAPVAAPTTPRVAASASKPSRIAARWTTLAASLMAAFALGWTLKYVEPSETPGALARVTPPAPENPAETAPFEAVALKDKNQSAPEAGASNRLVEEVVKTWVQSGYSAERQNTHVTVTFQDGSELEVPAQEIRLRYTGGRTY
jgi:hypothetical protein